MSRTAMDCSELLRVLVRQHRTPQDIQGQSVATLDIPSEDHTT